MYQLKRPIAIFVALILLFTTTVYAAPSDAASAENSDVAIPAVETVITGEITRIREEERLRTTNSETYLLSDGTYECVVYAEDKYYPGESNTLVKIDNSIVPAETGAQKKITSYKNASNVFDVSFSSEGTPKVTLAYGGSSLSFSPVQAISSGKETVANRASVLSVGRVENQTLAQLTPTGSNTATYANAFPNADLVYVLENGLLKEYIILKSNAASNSYSFLFQMDGVTLDTTGRNPAFVDAEGAVVFALADLFAMDANGKPTDAVAFSFQPTGNRGEIIITVTLDEAYLAAPERAFPVIIDPSTMVSSVETADTCVCSAFPTTNYYTSSYLRTGKDTDFGVRRSYIKFNLPPLPAQAGITSSKLKVEMLSGAVPGLYVYRNTGTWTSSTLTWNNKPAFTYDGGSNKAVSQGDGWYAATVTNIVKSWYSNQYAHYGFVLVDAVENNTSQWTTFYSSDAVSPHKPELHIEYSVPGLADTSTDYLYYIKGGSRYLKATGASAFTTTTSASTTSGTELWCFEKVSTGIYRIESLGVRHESSKGKHRNMLTAISSGNSGTLTLNSLVESSAAQQWELRGSSSTGYYIVSHAYPNLALSLSGTTPVLALYSGATTWTLTKTSYADYKGGGIANATKPYTVNIIVKASAITGFWHAGIFNCYTAWSDVNSNFQFKLSVNGNGDLYEAPDYTVWVEGSNMATAAGRTEQLSGTDDGQWTGATIWLSTHSGVINNSSHTDTDREKVFLHELGHALKLKHPHETNTNWRPLAIMCQNFPSENVGIPCRPSGYDICNLKRKWG